MMILLEGARRGPPAPSKPGRREGSGVDKDKESKEEEHALRVDRAVSTGELIARAGGHLHLHLTTR
ncbi:MAG TPA: hypothetical protein VG963_27100 [Polyangiaceae bacterium]|nr:hypothetical protein [Polyangiaceae bacterium]